MGYNKQDRSKKNFDQLDQQFMVSRRHFTSKMGLLLGALGVAPSLSLNLIEDLLKQLIPEARAQDMGLPQRMIYLGMRAGIPVMPYGAPLNFENQDRALTPNLPYRGNQFTRENGMLFSPDVRPLMAHAQNMVITQGVTTETGHIDLFNFWEGGQGRREVSPLIALAARNTSSSLLTGVHFKQANNRGRAVQHSLGGQPDLLDTDPDLFPGNFNKAHLALEPRAVEAIINASAKLSRRQAQRMTDRLRGAMNYSINQTKVVSLLTTDFSGVLAAEDLGQTFTTGITPTHRSFGRALAQVLKGMSLNAINSAAVELDYTDFHGLNTEEATPPHFRDMAAKLAAAVDYLKATPDGAGPLGTNLWDTTTLVVGSEFTRNDASFGEDNGDGGSQGILILSKKARGGFKGAINPLATPSE